MDIESTAIIHTRRDGFLLPFEVIDDETGLPPEDEVFTGGYMTIKRRKTDPDSAAVLQLQVTMTGDHTGQVAATAEQMDIDANRYFYDVQLTSSTMGPITILNDTFQIVQDITGATS